MPTREAAVLDLSALSSEGREQLVESLPELFDNRYVVRSASPQGLSELRAGAVERDAVVQRVGSEFDFVGDEETREALADAVVDRVVDGGGAGQGVDPDEMAGLLDAHLDDEDMRSPAGIPEVYIVAIEGMLLLVEGAHLIHSTTSLFDGLKTWLLGTGGPVDSAETVEEGILDALSPEERAQLVRELDQLIGPSESG